MQLIRFARVLLLVSICVASAAADHLPAHLIARGKPEHFLCAVDVYGSLNRVLRSYGRPDKSVRDEQGEGTYTWTRNGVEIAVQLMAYGAPKSLYAVDVWGSKAVGVYGRTGAGLTIGSDMQQVRRIYGNRFFRRSDRSILLEFKDETQLVIDFDANGHIEHMSLEASVE